LIGSVHYLKQGEAYIPIDRSRADILQGVIAEWFGGDAMAFIKAYYEAVASLPQRGKFDIIGHFDLITKNLDAYPLFDDTSDAYIRCAVEAMEALRPYIPIFEVNTGAISRGYRTTPYPHPFLLEFLKEKGWGACISSDCHDGNFLKQSFDDSAELLKSVGFKEIYVLKENGFEAVGLD
jgi:histidinol-phosphatase (PHP family)